MELPRTGKPNTVNRSITIQGYQLAKYKRDSAKTQYFKEESQKLTKVGEQIAKILYGKDHPHPQEWKEMQLLFERI